MSGQKQYERSYLASCDMPKNFFLELVNRREIKIKMLDPHTGSVQEKGELTTLFLVHIGFQPIPSEVISWGCMLC